MSSHPMADALVEFSRSHGIEPKPGRVGNFQNFPGEGIYGNVEDNEIFIGNSKIASRAGCTEVPNLGGYDVEGKSVGYVFLGSSPAGIFCLSDVCRTGAKEAIEELKSIGIRTVMLTGDCHGAAKRAQEQLGGALDVIHADLLPEDKARIIEELQKENPTAMIGDGLNDAPALATADIGISMGVSGSALATKSGDIVLMSNDIQRIAEAFRLAKHVQAKIIENVIISISTKAAILGLALAGHPLVWAAVLADVGTCLLVIFNSMLLLKGGRKKCYQSKSHDSHKSRCCVLSSRSYSGDKKCSTFGEKYDQNAHCHPHDEMRVKDDAHYHLHDETTTNDHECCHEDARDLESKKSHEHSCSDNEHSRCGEKNNRAKSANKEDKNHGTHKSCDHQHNHSTSCKSSLESPVADELATSKEHCLENQCTNHKDYTYDSGRHVTKLGCKNSGECKGIKACLASPKKCCESYRRECCIRNKGHFGTTFRGGLSEIVIE